MADVLKIYKALADETRLRLVRLLARGAFSVNEIIDILHMGQSRISRHLKILTEAGLVSNRREGTWIYYQCSEAADAMVAEVLVHLRRHGQAVPFGAEDLQSLETVVERRREQTRTFFDSIEDPQEFLHHQSLDGSFYRRIALSLLPPLSGVALDLGTGSGAIGLSVAVERVGTRVWCTDVSPDALAVARANCAGLGSPAQRVTVAEGLWFDALPVDLRGRFEVIASNPPYVAPDEDLPAEVLDWEPGGALFSDDRGMADLRVLVSGAWDWLAPGGALVLEMAPDQTGLIAELAQATGYVEVSVRRDLADRDRALVARRCRYGPWRADACRPAFRPAARWRGDDPSRHRPWPAVLGGQLRHRPYRRGGVARHLAHFRWNKRRSRCGSECADRAGA